MVWYSSLLRILFVVIHTVKGFHVVNEGEIDVFLELTCFFHDPVDVINLMSGSTAFSKTKLNDWNFTVHILLKTRRILGINLLACEMSEIMHSLSLLWHCLSLELE